MPFLLDLAEHEVIVIKLLTSR